MKEIRLRYAPSPTGPLHCGGIRTALYNYLFVKKYGGKLILRIEDTDSERFVDGAEEYIQKSFDWLGIKFDESPTLGGNYGPYRQSERKDIYKKYVNYLIDNGFAYYAFDSSDELNNLRENDSTFAYDSNHRQKLKNSLTLSNEVVDNLLKTTNDYVVRIKYPDNPTDIEFNDIIRGNISINTSTLDDKVIWKKKDELPTYHLANVVDDHLMEISHVVRGEEWIPSTPLHVYLYNCFGWDMPNFAHLPLILGPKGKLSKRDGDKYGFPVYALEWVDPNDSTKISTGYDSYGYLPDAVINILAFLGWNPGTTKEVYSMDELINDFDLSRVNKAGAKFNLDKAKWFNGQHLKTKSNDILLNEFKNKLDDKNISIEDNKIIKILNMYKDRVNFINDIIDEISFMFYKPSEFDPKGLKKWNSDSPILLKKLNVHLSNINEWTEDNIKNEFESFVNDNNIKFGNIAPQLRLVLTGNGGGVSLFDIMELLGKNESLDRMVNYNIPNNNINVLSTKKQPSNEKLIKLNKDFENLIKLIDGTQKKLKNPSFINKAPKHAIENELTKLESYLTKKNELQKEISDIN